MKNYEKNLYSILLPLTKYEKNITILHSKENLLLNIIILKNNPILKIMEDVK